MASAVKVRGERLYRAHRRGEEVERESSPITVHALKLVAYDPEAAAATFRIICGSGTYVRSLISDLAYSLGVGAYLTALRRTSVGHLKVEDAISLDELGPGTLYQCIIQPRMVLAHLPEVEVSGDDRRSVCSGRAMGAFGLVGSYRVGYGGELLAIYRDVGGVAKAEVVLCAG